MPQDDSGEHDPLPQSLPASPSSASVRNLRWGSPAVPKIVSTNDQTPVANLPGLPIMGGSPPSASNSKRRGRALLCVSPLSRHDRPTTLPGTGDAAVVVAEPAVAIADVAEIGDDTIASAFLKSSESRPLANAVDDSRIPSGAPSVYVLAAGTVSESQTATGMLPRNGTNAVTPKSVASPTVKVASTIIQDVVGQVAAVVARGVAAAGGRASSGSIGRTSRKRLGAAPSRSPYRLRSLTGDEVGPRLHNSGREETECHAVTMDDDPIAVEEYAMRAPAAVEALRSTRTTVDTTEIVEREGSAASIGESNLAVHPNLSIMTTSSQSPALGLDLTVAGAPGTLASPSMLAGDDEETLTTSHTQTLQPSPSRNDPVFSWPLDSPGLRRKSQTANDSGPRMQPSPGVVSPPATPAIVPPERPRTPTAFSRALAETTSEAPDRMAKKLIERLKQSCHDEASRGRTSYVWEATLSSGRRFSDSVARAFAGRVQDLGFSRLEWFSGKEWKEMPRRYCLMHDSMYDKYNLRVRVRWPETLDNFYLEGTFGQEPSDACSPIHSGTAHQDEARAQELVNAALAPFLRQLQQVAALQQQVVVSSSAAQAALEERAARAEGRTLAAERRYIEVLRRLRAAGGTAAATAEMAAASGDAVVAALVSTGVGRGGGSQTLDGVFATADAGAGCSVANLASADAGVGAVGESLGKPASMAAVRGGTDSSADTDGVRVLDWTELSGF
eukprot:TRINITY_DN41430_c0_g1_i1.p1 TRINITY_DN41430_c0_g1~~TRINITY_DN41430_c0_g1_i1.p1  ORF type:complete len:794 (+),score=109.63 TRINITY_DN41430_c0_g1_i1:198-2384(+)